MTRLLILTATLLLGSLTLDAVSTSEAIPVRVPLADLSLDVAPWHGQHAGDLPPDILNVLGVDDYINRFYSEAGGAPVGLYVGYYESQREGDTMHSPLNCLPGSGWEPVSHRLSSIAVQSPQAAATGSRSRNMTARREVSVISAIVTDGQTGRCRLSSGKIVWTKSVAVRSAWSSEKRSVIGTVIRTKAASVLFRRMASTTM